MLYPFDRWKTETCLFKENLFISYNWQVRKVIQNSVHFYTMFLIRSSQRNTSDHGIFLKIQL